MLKSDLHAPGVSALGTMGVVLFPERGQGTDTDTLATPSCTIPFLGFSPLGLPTSATLVELLGYMTGFLSTPSLL